MRGDDQSLDPAPPRGVGLLALVLALGTGLYGAAFWIGVDEGPPADAFPAAAKIIRDGHQPGDLILVVPHYATRVFEQLGDLRPVAPLEPLDEDFGRHPRVWVFGIFGKAAPVADGLRLMGFVEQQAVERNGITVHRFDNPFAETVRYDFLARLRDAEVFHEKNGTKTACSEWKPGRGGMGRWACPYDKEWFYVAPEYHLMGDHQRLCLWAHPPSEGRLLVRYPAVPLAGRIAGRAGHTLNGSLNARASVELDVAVGIDAVPQRFSFDLEAYDEPFLVRTATAGTATVTFAVSTVDAGVNHFCFRADVRARREEGAP